MSTTSTDTLNRTRAATRDAAADASRRAGRAANAVHDEFGALVADAEDLLKNTADTMGAQTASARARLQNTISKAKDSVAAGAEAVAAQARDAAGAADEFVRDNPWQSLGLAAVAGLAVGLMISRR